MKYMVSGIFIFFCILTAANADAYKKGDLELTLGGNGSSDENFDGTIMNIEAGLGIFVTRNFEGIWRQGISFADTENGKQWNGSTRLAFDYHFDIRSRSWNPYLGFNLGYLYGDTVEEQFISGPEAGVKFFVNRTTYIVGAIEYQFLFADTHDADDNFDEGRFVYILGIGFTF